MNAYRIGFIYSYALQRDMIEKSLSEEKQEIESTFEFGVLEEAIPFVRSMEMGGTEAIVAWHPTAELIEQNATIPVVNIPVNDLDIIRAALQAKKSGSKIAVAMGRENRDMKIIEEIIGVKLEQILFSNVKDYQYGFMKAINDGYEIFLGKSHLTLDLAEKYGKKGFIITVQPRNIVEAIQNAKRVIQIRRDIHTQYVWLQTLMNNLGDGVLVCDRAGLITFINKTAQSMLEVQTSILGQPASQVLPSIPFVRVLRQQVIDDEIVSVNGKTIVVNCKVVASESHFGILTILKEVQEIRQIDTKLRQKAISKGFVTRYTFNHFSGHSHRMNRTIQYAKRFAYTDADILITGETGTGKEVMAQSIHAFSKRSKNPFVAVNCSVIPENLLESELFGYEEGAFTGAKKGGKIGLFELAHQGTLFLDEIGNMPIELQSKLLRVIQEREVMRLGGNRMIPIDVRIIAATNRDIVLEMQTGSFREDLYFRMSVLSIEMPSLRERKEDIPDLISKLLFESCLKYRKNKIEVSQQMIKELAKQQWQGNVRQLNNIIERYVLLISGKKTFDNALMRELLRSQKRKRDTHSNHPKFITDPKKKLCRNTGVKTIVDIEREWVLDALCNTNFNISRAAEALSISRSTLYKKMRSFKLL